MRTVHLPADDAPPRSGCLPQAAPAHVNVVRGLLTETGKVAGIARGRALHYPIPPRPFRVHEERHVTAPLFSNLPCLHSNRVRHSMSTRKSVFASVGCAWPCGP